MSIQKHKNDIMNFGDKGGRVGGKWGIKDYIVGTEYTGQVLGTTKFQKSSLKNLNQMLCVPPKLLKLKNLKKKKKRKIHEITQ